MSTIDNKTRVQIETAPTVEPVSVAEFKMFARLDHDDEDSALLLMLASVRKAAEMYLGRSLLEQTIYYTLDKWEGREVELPAPPLLSVLGVYTKESDGTWTEYDSENYFVVTEGIPGSIVVKQSVTAPTAYYADAARFQIRYKAGYGDTATDVPAAIRQAILGWATVAYATRAVTIDPPPEVRSMLSLYRVERLK
jgi:uncharacterized phiE125 gp8 family phage protein